MAKYSIGLDYGTESVRALLVDVADGTEIAQSVRSYPHGVINHKLPGCDKNLPQDFALQCPKDYWQCGLEVIREVASKVRPQEIIGLGVDFTACTMLPVDSRGTPLMEKEEFAQDPHAWVKLWKHHGASKEAEAINQLAKSRKEKFLDYYGGSISCEWMLPKVWETLKNNPNLYNQTDYFVDAGDWIVFKLTGVWTRSACFAGYKGFWNSKSGFPSKEFMKALDPKLENVEEKWVNPILAPGDKAGYLTAEVAKLLNLSPDTAVSVATIDAHSGVAGMGVYTDGTGCLIMGTSTCHMFLSQDEKLFQGPAGIVKDGIIPGLYGMESGQAAVGDLFSWFTKKLIRPLDSNKPFETIAPLAYALKPGESGLMALDWMNGNRSILMNPELSGMILGLTLETKEHEIFRALVEATAFGTKRIVDQYIDNGVGIHTLCVCGGLAQIPELVQIYADILDMPITVAHSNQAVALGAAIFGALAAGSSGGGHGHIEDAVVHMTKKSDVVYNPNPKHTPIYKEIYRHYRDVHDFFGIKNPQIMENLKSLKNSKEAL